MTNEEALAILEDGILSGKTDTPENNEALDLAIMAFMKQIPKKPISMSSFLIVCRQCHSEIRRGMWYCKSCGQAIDWRDITGE